MPIRLTAAGRLVNRAGTADHTAAMEALPLPAAGLDGYVFKAKSPSCDIRAISRYGEDGTAVSADGRGRYADRVLRAYPLLAVEDDEGLNDTALREAFSERIFAAARLRSEHCHPQFELVNRQRDPPKTRPGRPDQRIRARRLMPRRTAGHQADPIFERDTPGWPATAAPIRRSTPGSSLSADGRMAPRKVLAKLGIGARRDLRALAQLGQDGQPA